MTQNRFESENMQIRGKRYSKDIRASKVGHGLHFSW